VKSLKVGDRVYIGMAMGCFSEEIVVPEYYCWKLPKTFTFSQGAAFPVGAMTAYHG